MFSIVSIRELQSVIVSDAFFILKIAVIENQSNYFNLIENNAKVSFIGSSASWTVKTEQNSVYLRPSLIIQKKQEHRVLTSFQKNQRNLAVEENNIDLSSVRKKHY